VQVMQLEEQETQVEVRIERYVESGQDEMHLLSYSTPAMQDRQSKDELQVSHG